MHTLIVGCLEALNNKECEEMRKLCLTPVKRQLVMGNLPLHYSRTF